MVPSAESFLRVLVLLNQNVDAHPESFLRVLPSLKQTFCAKKTVVAPK